MKRITMLAILAAILSGCAIPPPKQLSRDEWLKTTTRYYPNSTKEQVIAAAERVYRLADGNDFNIVHLPEGIQASRNWTSYAVIVAVGGTDHWRLTATQNGDGVTAFVQASTQSQAVTPMPTTGGDWTASTGPLLGNPIDGTALYDVFWARMDYMLGLRSNWMSCKEADERVKSGITWGNNEPLCNSFNMTDSTP